MSDFSLIDSNDPRYATLQKGFNLRFPTTGQGANAIYVCKTPQDVLDAANAALAQGCRITVRSGGHCYEGFVANKLPEDHGQPLAIIDLSLMTGLRYREAGDIASPWNPAARYRFAAAAGNQNWDGYLDLYKTANRTLPGGSCYSVGSGGHIVGGGYGLLSRLHGLTVDWLSGVDILVPQGPGSRKLVPKHVNLHSAGADRDLFIACRGGGGGNFGIILTYYYAELPVAPQEAYWLSLSYPWANFGTGTAGRANFARFMRAYWQWFADHDADWNSPDPAKANGGLFTLLKVQHRSTGDVVLSIQYTGKDGKVGGARDQPFLDFVATMNAAAGAAPGVNLATSWHGPSHRMAEPAPRLLAHAVNDAQQMDWLWLTQSINGSGSNQRGKYKSAYHKANFSDVEIMAMWEYLNGSDDPRLNQALVQIDSYGGRINRNDEAANPTSVCQRSSLLKSQFQVYWTDPAQDAFHIKWIADLYDEYFAQYGGKPSNQPGSPFEGCYINYPDTDMKYTDASHTQVDPQWLDLYYGNKTAALIATKRNVDPDNLFHHEMSIPLVAPQA
ncbi:FAD-binding protein [Achromobacter xylosoxidans]|uniref:BBE domain-containing protein n=1 Tax=Alcaligenes xylosoxydans xylosoxydans TaxID=85698 RepID=UPI000971247D|nr:BBE domain-containing protein [Achromobacter xylosoxidans]OMG78942.1 FAD-binding protein [Achromobacter xylosoxidans]